MILWFLFKYIQQDKWLFINTAFYTCLIIILYIIIFSSKSPKGPYVKYTQIKDQLKTGDIILLHCNGTISKVIRAVTRGTFSHCGVVVKYKGKLYLFEADCDDCYNVLTKEKSERGPRLVLLEDKMKRADNIYFGWIPIKKKISKKKIYKFINKSKSYTFSEKFNLWPMYRLNWTFLNNFLNKQQRNNSYYCSDMVIAIFKNQGLIHPSVSNYYLSPSDLINIRDYCIDENSFGKYQSFEYNIIEDISDKLDIDEKH
jgi:hypothetical protein